MADASPIKIGPFTGGMNTYSDPTAIGDNEAVLIENYDVDIDGSLISRLPIVAFMNDAKYNDAVMLGTFRLPNGNNYFILSNQTTTFAYLIGSNATPIQITATFGASAAVQYDSKIWLVAPVGSSGTGGSWDGTTFVANAYGMPKGNCACIYKEVMWIGQTTTNALYFCKPLGSLDPTPPALPAQGGGPGGRWYTEDFIYIGKGDGQSLTDIRTFNNVVVVFKSNSTYIWAYDSAPTRGTAQKVSAVIGSRWPYTAVEHENSLYILSGNSVFQITNWNFEPISIKIPFVYTNADPTHIARSPNALSVVNERLFVRYYDKIYIYNLKTRAWTIWTSALTPERWFRDPIMDPALGVYTYYALSCRNNVPYMFRMYDDFVTGATEASFNLNLLTKTFNVEVPYTYKRLFWWGVDCLSKVPINALVIPTVYSRPIKWQDLIDNNLKWNQLGTWSRLMETSINVSDSATMTTVGNTRTFVKYWKSLRFRQIAFQLSSALTGNTLDSPQIIYNVTAVIANKQVVTAKVN